MSHPTPPPLDVILGPEGAARLIRRLAAQLTRDDALHPDTALRLACERATDGDPILLAAPGQCWRLRDDVDPDDAPARMLSIHARLAAPPRIIASDADAPGEASRLDELLLTVLDMYELAYWTPIDAPAAGGIA
jgi:hypothetical protein